jgi:hypothetical protein
MLICFTVRREPKKFENHWCMGYDRALVTVRHRPSLPQYSCNHCLAIPHISHDQLEARYKNTPVVNTYHFTHTRTRTALSETTPFVCNRLVPDSNLNRDTDYPHRDLRGIP